MLETNPANKSLLSFVADYAQVMASEEELATFQSVLDSNVKPVQNSSDTILEGIEPVTTFRVSTVERPQATSSSALPVATDSALATVTDDVIYLSVSEVQALFQAKRLSPVELTQAIVKRIEQVNPQLHAYITLVTEQALAAATQAEKDIMAGNIRGPLHGIPLALKDLVETKGIRTTASSKVLAEYIPAQTATVAQKLEEAGAILLGKTHTDEFAYGVICPSTRTSLEPDGCRVCSESIPLHRFVPLLV